MGAALRCAALHLSDRRRGPFARGLQRVPQLLDLSVYE